MPGGRPPLLDDPQLVAELITAIEEGCSYNDAASSVGICRATVMSWMAKGRAPRAKRKYVDFLDRVTRARAKCKQTLIKSVYKARDKDWRAASYMLAVMDSSWCLEKRADEKRVTNHILDVAKEALGQEAYDRLLDALADDQERR